MQNILNLLKLTVVALLFATCIREIELETAPGDLTTLVVDGSYTGTGPDQVRLSKPNQFAFSAFVAISDASVRVVDSEGNSAFYEKKNGAGNTYFELPLGAFPPVPGRQYFVEITLFDNGRIYRSYPQTMPAALAADSILVEGLIEQQVSDAGVVIEQKKARISVQSNVPQGAGDYFIRWETDCVYFFPELPQPGPLPPPTKKCYVTDKYNAQQFPLLALEQAAGKTITQQIGSKDVDDAFAKSVYFNVVQRSITKEAFEFWRKFSQVANPGGTVFDPPAAAVRGNVYNTQNDTEVPLGYFEVAAVDTIRRQVFNGDLGPDFFRLAPCDPNDYRTYDKRECFDCLVLKNSTTVKPYYWQ